MTLQYFNCSALLLVKLATTQVGTTPRSLNHGISHFIRIDNSIVNRHLVTGIDYLISSGLSENSIPFFANEVKKEIYLEDITEIIPIGADKLLITLSIDGEIHEAYCSAIKYGVIDEVANRPQYWKSFLNLSGPNIAVEHLNKYYKHLASIYVDSLESSSILSIEPYVEKDIIVDSNFSDWANPYSAKKEFSYKNIDKIWINVDRQRRTISLSDSIVKSYTCSDHDGGFETTEFTLRMSCTIKFGSIGRLESRLRIWEESGYSICDNYISFPNLKYREIESKLGIKFSFSNSSSTYPA